METATRSDTSVRFGDFELDLQTRELSRNGSRLKIRGHPIDVLAILLEHPGELVTREILQKRLWPENTFVDFEQILNNSIGKLRDALGDRADSPKFIETLPRLGYRFIAPVETSAINDAARVHAAAAPQPAGPIATTSSNPPRLSRHWIVWPVIALASAFAFFVYWSLHRPLLAPRISHYEQLTVDSRQKIPIGTDGARIYMDLPGPPGPGRGVGEVSVSGGKVTEVPIEAPLGGGFRSGLYGVSPDGSSLLVMNHWREGEYVLWVVGTMGGPARYLTRAHAAAWSPDGRTIIYASAHGDMYTIPVQGGEPRLLRRLDAPPGQVTRTRYISWSPDGITIRFSRWGGRIYEMSSTGANLHEWLPGWNGSVPKCCGRWTPDGQFFVFLAGRTLAKGPRAQPLAQIWAVDERHGRMRPSIPQPIQLTSGPLLWGDPLPSRDGKKIFARGVSLHGELVRYDPKAKRLDPYLGGISAEMPAFSRDGKYVAYVSFPEGILWRANRDGSGLLQLSEPPLYPRNPRWSPDGTQILFIDNTKNGVDALYVISSQGGIPKHILPENGGQNTADWSPDGTKMVYSVGRGHSFLPLPGELGQNELRIAELETGRITERAKGLWDPRWSPDGRYIAAQSSVTTELRVLDLKTRKWNVLAQDGEVGFLNWSQDGRFIYFQCWTKDNVGVYRVPFQGGKAELVFDLPVDFRGTGWLGFWMSLDPTDAPLLLRDVGTDEIYALSLDPD